MSTEVAEAETPEASEESPAEGKQEQTRQVLLGTLTNYLQLFTKIVAGMVMVSFNVKYLTVSGNYDFWVWVWTVFSVVFLLDFGLGFSLARFIPPLMRKGEVTRVREAISAVFWLFSIAGAIIFGVGALAAVYLPQVFKVFEVQHREPFLLFTFFMAVNFPTNVFRDSLFALHRIALRNLIGIAVDIATLISAITLYRAGFGLTMIISVMGCAIAARNTACLVGVWKVLGEFPIIFRFRAIDRIREMLSFSLYTYVTSFSNLVLKMGAVTIVGFFTAVGAGPYGPARTLASHFEDFTQQLQQVLPPLIGSMAGDVARQGEIFLRLSRFVLCFACAVYFPLVLHLPTLFETWVPELQMLDTAIWVGRVLLTKSFIAVVLLSPSQAVLLMADRHRPVAAATTLSAVSACLLAIPGWYLDGLVGVAVAFTLGTMMGGGVLLPDGWRFAKVNFSAYFKRVVAPVLLPLIPLLGILAVGLQFGGEGILERFATSVVASLSFVAVYLITVSEDRVVAVSLYHRLRGRG